VTAGWTSLLVISLLISSSVLLTFDPRSALASACAEMDYPARPELRKARRWRMFREPRERWRMEETPDTVNRMIRVLGV